MYPSARENHGNMALLHGCVCVHPSQLCCFIHILQLHHRIQGLCRGAPVSHCQTGALKVSKESSVTADVNHLRRPQQHPGITQQVVRGPLLPGIYSGPCLNMVLSVLKQIKRVQRKLLQLF